MTLFDALAPTLLVIAAALLLLGELDRDDRRVRTGAFLLIFVLTLRYLYWRILYTLPPLQVSGASLFAWSFVALDVYLLLTSFEYLWGLREHRVRVVAEPASSSLNLATSAPMIDVLVPTYNEAEGILEKTVIGAKLLDYPNFRVWILDDSARDWLKRRAEEWGVHYLARPTNEHAKAGNLNHALQVLTALPDPPAFVAVFDADFIAQRQFLRRTMALMADESVAIVQTPQFFYNADPFQHAFGVRHGWPDTQRMIYEVDMPARDAGGGATCCGTSFLVRAEALAKLGGFSTDSVSEDTLTSMRLSSLGLRTVYLNEALSMGLAAEGLAAHLGQQWRWCFGWMQISRTEFGPFVPGLSWLDRLRLLNQFTSWGVSALLRIVFMITPILYWWLGLAPMEATAAEFTAYFLPMWAAITIVCAWISRGAELPIYTDAIAVVSSFTVVKATLRGLFGARRARFEVTAKGTQTSGVVIHWFPLIWLVTLAALTASGLLRAALFPPDEPAGFSGWAYFWSLWNLLIFYAACVPCIEWPKRRLEERFAAESAVSVSGSGWSCRVRLRNVGLGGACLAERLPATAGDRAQLVFGEAGPISATILESTPGRTRLEFRPTVAQRAALIAELYTFAYVPLVKAGSVLAVGRALARRALA